ncbi:hypothetical protein [Nitrospira moscoviensis]|uniref:DUF5666 domain-containing protein n=1 Tax=Nitrospira moscoviensis TaxID=42253 RepID=A0A0K2GDE3_NITMO|nr:hypothetical protein [Nitrospira moscoviensis]ALA58963.1 exported protein of unknown function [Nitrospira moscoviensis]
MMMLLSGLAFVLGSLLFTPPPASAGPKDPKHFIVDIVSINGEEYIVRDEAGAEGKIHVGADTEKYGHFQPGDRIDAWVYPNGDAKTIIILRSAATIQEDQRQRAAQQQEQRAQR